MSRFSALMVQGTTSDAGKSTFAVADEGFAVLAFGACTAI